MTATSATKPVSVSVAGASQLTLKVTNAGGYGSGCDHADWADARLTSSDPTTTSTSDPTTIEASTTTTTSEPTTTTSGASTTTTTSEAPTTTSSSPPVAVTADVFLSDLAWSSMSNGYGPVERDMSNGMGGAGDGRAITLNGVTSAKGLGVHATSTVTYPLGGAYLGLFLANVGVDDECGGAGTVVFEVLVDGVKRFNDARR